MKINYNEEGHIVTNIKIYSPEDKIKTEFECDVDIAPLILLLNKKGFLTSYCCSGHEEDSFTDFYIAFRKSMNEDKYDKLLEILNDIPSIVIEENYDICASKNGMCCMVCNISDGINIDDFKDFIFRQGGFTYSDIDIDKCIIIRIKKFKDIIQTMQIKLNDGEDSLFFDILKNNRDTFKMYRDKIILALYDKFSELESFPFADDYCTID